MFTIIIDLDYVYDIQISLRYFSVNDSVELSYNLSLQQMISGVTYTWPHANTSPRTVCSGKPCIQSHATVLV